MSHTPGTLFIVSTPIGNLGDITYRAVDVLRSVQLICAEDTRHVRKLLDRYEITTPVQSHHKDNEARSTAQIVERLTNGQNVALVTDAGTPLVSDPGQRLVKSALARGIDVVPVPGASALLAALVASGADTSVFTFVGFLPRSGAERKLGLSRLSALAHTSVLFESPTRLAATLQDLATVGLGDWQASVARELTKKHEEIRRGTVAELAAYYGANPVRGEVVIVLEGRGVVSEPDEGAARDKARAMKSSGARTKDIVAVLMDQFGIARNRAYALTQEEDR